MWLKAIEMQICNVHSNKGEDTVSSSQYSELTLKLQCADFIGAAAATWNIVTAAVLVIQGLSVKLAFIRNAAASQLLTHCQLSGHNSAKKLQNQQRCYACCYEHQQESL